MANPAWLKKYLRIKPEVNQIYEDLEKYHDWVRLQYPAIPFNPSDLYKHSSPHWQKYMKQQSRKHRSNKKDSNERG